MPVTGLSIEAIAEAVLAKLSTKQKPGADPRCLCGECYNCKALGRHGAHLGLFSFVPRDIEHF
jgi:hypothetical protein